MCIGNVREIDSLPGIRTVVHFFSKVGEDQSSSSFPSFVKGGDGHPFTIEEKGK